MTTKLEGMGGGSDHKKTFFESSVMSSYSDPEILANMFSLGCGIVWYLKPRF